MKIYIVEGHSGEYEDKKNWITNIFTSKEKAENICLLAQEIANDIHKKDFDDDMFDPYEEKNEFDKNMQWAYTGVNYSWKEFEVIE